MRRYSLYLFDLDGTLYRGDEVVGGAVEAVNELHRLGSKVGYVTNNSTQTVAFYARKLLDMGFPVEEGLVLSSAVGAARFLSQRDLGSAYVVGEDGLVATLQEQGIRVVNASPEGGARPTPSDVAEAVVVGLCRSFEYSHVSHAMSQILAGADFVATNTDATFPLEGGRLAPGAGAMVAAVRACVGREPIVVGKPQPFLTTLAMELSGFGPRDTLVVGDRRETDLASGKAAGADTHLVLTGVTKEPQVGESFSKDLTALLDVGA